MKKFHKRAAVFLTAATLAGLPAGAFFYSSPGSLTVWADNVEVESSEESSPEDVDFSDGSEVEIHADPVEQAQEDAGNDVTETPEVGITFTEPEGWQTDTATVKIQVEDTKNTGAFSIAKVEARLSENGGWSDITGNMEVSISSNCSVYVRVTDQNGNTYEQNRYTCNAGGTGKEHRELPEREVLSGSSSDGWIGCCKQPDKREKCCRSDDGGYEG